MRHVIPVICALAVAFVGAHSASAALFGVPNNYLSLNSSLIGWWTFDGKDMIQNVVDRSGNGHHGNQINAGGSTTTAPGMIGQSMAFSSSTKQINIPDHANFTIDTTGQYTWSMWANPADLRTDNERTLFAQSQNGNVGFWLYMDSFTFDNGVYAYLLTNGFSNYRLVGVNNVFATNKWYHITVVYDATESVANDRFRIYVDGVRVSGAVTANGTLAATMNPTTVRIGGNAQWTDEGYNGMIDDVRFYNRELSDSEIRSLSNVGKVAIGRSQTDVVTSGIAAHWTFDARDVNWSAATTSDVSGNGNEGTLTFLTASASAAIGKIGQAMSFDGNVTSVALAASPVSDFSSASAACAWGRTNDSSVTPTGWNQTSLNIKTDSDNGARMGVTSDNKAYVAYRVGGNARGVQSSAALFPDNTWTHTCYSYNGSFVTLYVNGISVATSSNTDSLGGVNTLGARDDEGNGNWYGDLDDIRVYERALSAGEVATIYAAGRGYIIKP